MEQNEITVTLGSETFSFKEEDRIGALMYKLYHDQIYPLIDEYLASLAMDINAVNRETLNGMTEFKEQLIMIKNLGRDDDSLRAVVGSLARPILVYRDGHTNDYTSPSDTLLSIILAFKNAGEDILDEIFCNHEFSITADDIDKRIISFKEYLMKKNSEQHMVDDIDENDTLNMCVTLCYYDQAKFYFDLFEARNKYVVLEDIYNTPQLVQKVLNEIQWRQEYLKNPQTSSMEISLSCEQAIFDLIVYTSEALELSLNSSYFSWDAHSSCLRIEETLKNPQVQGGKALVIKALKTFPFDEDLYKYILREFGDADGTVTSLADFFYIDINPYRRELFKEYVNTLPAVSMDNEQAIQNRLNDIINKKNFWGYNAVTEEERALRDKLTELDIIFRTVRGRLYETREEAERVRNDYRHLADLIKSFDFDSCNLLNQDSVSAVKEYMISETYESDAFKSNSELVLEELEPILNHHIQNQIWKKRIISSNEPWKTVEEIIRESGIFSDKENDVKYWNFGGLKKYYPTLIEYERPILFFKISLFGWRNYLVVTNKRILNVKKNTQTVLLIGDQTHVDYREKRLSFFNGEKAPGFEFLLTYKGQNEECLAEVLNLIIHTIRQCNEILFGVSNDFHPTPGNIPLSNMAEIRYCSQCGHKLIQGAAFCSQCGSRIRRQRVK